jgi:hypothetical protein
MLIGAQTPKLIYQKRRKSRNCHKCFTFQWNPGTCRVKRGYKAMVVCCFFGEEVCGSLKSILSSALQATHLMVFILSFGSRCELRCLSRAPERKLCLMRGNEFSLISIFTFEREKKLFTKAQRMKNFFAAPMISTPAKTDSD